MRALYNSFASIIEKLFHIDAHYFLSGGFWLTLGQIVSIVFGLITTALFAHFLSETEYGVYRYLVGIAALFWSFSLTGLGQSILQTAAKKYHGFYRETLGTSFIYSLTITLFSLIGAGYYWLNENITLATGCALIALLQPAINTFQFIPAFLLGSRRFRESTTLQILRIFVISAASIGALLITKNVIILFATYLVSHFLTNLISHLIFQPKILSTPQKVFEKYIRYAKHTSIRNVIANVSQRLDIILAFTQLGAVELAVYSIATVVPEQIKGSFKNLATLLLPKYAAHTNTEQLKKGIPKRSLQLFLILSIITIVYILVAPYAYQLIFPKYPDAVLYSQLSALAFPTFILFIPYSILQAQLEEKILYKLTLYSSIFQITIVFFGILTFGLIGAIIARIIYRLFFMIIIYSYTQKI